MKLSGWGKNITIYTRQVLFYKKDKKIKFNSSMIARGGGRAYGDSSLNKNQVLDTSYLSKIIEFDEINGLIFCESGIKIYQILKIIVSKGWMLPCCPGSKFISLGGIIASNTHGKDQHLNGSIENFVDEIYLDIGSEIILCSKKKNSEYFYNTIGGIGLTGIIIKVRLRLKKIRSSNLQQTKFVSKNLKETIKLFELQNNYEYFMPG